MAFELKREQYVVEAYHYDLRDPNVEIETSINVELTPMVPSKGDDYPENDSIIGAHLQFQLVFDAYLIGGNISQINHIINRKVEKQEDLNSQEVENLVAPLFDIVKRLTYEVTEIALDEPGITLNFESNFGETPKN